MKVYTFQSSASVEEEHLEYVTADVQNWDIHIWSWQQFTALLTNNEGSLIKKLLDKLNDSSEEDQSPISLSTNWKPMSERMRDHTEKNLEEIVKTNINELLKIIDLNILKDQMSDRLNISEQEVFKEGKSTRREPYFGYEPKKVSKFLQIGVPESWSSFWPEDQIHELLLKRKKGQHLTEDEILFIDRQLQRSPSSLKFMQRKYWLSRATIRRISKKTKFDKQSKEWNPIQLGNHKTLSENAKKAVRNYLHPPWEPKSIAEFQGFIESELNETYSKHRIRNFITGEMKYTYKKGSSRPPVYS